MVYTNGEQYIGELESLAFNVESTISGYKDVLAQKEKEENALHRQLGKRMAALAWTIMTGSW